LSAFARIGTLLLQKPSGSSKNVLLYIDRLRNPSKFRKCTNYIRALPLFLSILHLLS